MEAVTIEADATYELKETVFDSTDSKHPLGNSLDGLDISTNRKSFSAASCLHSWLEKSSTVLDGHENASPRTKSSERIFFPRLAEVEKTIQIVARKTRFTEN